MAGLRQVGGAAPALSSEDTCFPVGSGCVSVGRVEQRVEGVQSGSPPSTPPGEQEIKEKEHFHTASAVEGLYAPVEPRSCFKTFFNLTKIETLKKSNNLVLKL